MFLKRSFFILSFLLFVTRPFQAAEQTEAPALKLGLADVLLQTEARNPQLLSAKQNIAVAAAGKSIAEAGVNPRLSVDYPFGLGETVHSIMLEQPLELGGKRRARVALASDQIKQAQLQFDLLRWQTRETARQAYFELVVSQAALNETHQAILINRELADIAGKRFAAGDIAEAEVIQAQFALARTQPKLESALNRTRQAELRLHFILDQSSETKIVPTDELKFSDQQSLAFLKEQIPALEILLREADQSRLELLIARHQTRLSADQIELARSGKVPDLTLAGGYLWDPTISATSTLIGIRMDLPVFNQHQGELDQALANLKLAEEELSAMHRQVHMEVESAYQNFLTAQKALDTDRLKLLPQSQQVLDLAEKSYQLGQTSLTDVLVAQQSVLDVRDSFFADVLNYETALGALERAVNQPLTEVDHAAAHS